MTDIDTLNIRLDKLRGAEEIAEFLDEPLDRVRYLIRNNLIPYGKEGSGRIIASRRALREHYLRATAGNLAKQTEAA
jgi:hypothetical protein